MNRSFFFALIFLVILLIIPASAQTAPSHVISSGTTLDPQAVITSAQQLAKSLANPGSAQWQAKGDQHRMYHFPDASYRQYIASLHGSKELWL